jgi:BMFP domain-containing protein YqiC
MINPDSVKQLFDHEFFSKASSLFNDSSLKDDLEKQFRVLLQSQLRKLDVVSRDEFDAQSAVLQRSREKLEQLEQQLDALQKQLDQQ